MDIVKFTEFEEKILELYTKGLSKSDIAVELEIPIREVKKVFNKPKVKEKLAEIIEFRELKLKEKHLELLDEITEKMIEDANGDASKLLNQNRDILDVIAVADKLTKEQEKKRLGTSQNNVLVQILNQLGDD